MCKKFIVTGASGFIGKSLTKELLRTGNIVYAVVRDTSKLYDIKDYENLHIIEALMSDYGELSNRINETIDVFYHLAWNGYGTATNDPNIQFENVIFSIDAFKAAEKLNVKKFIFTGTSHEYLKKNIDGSMKYCSIYGSAKSSFKCLARILAQNSSMLFNSTIFSHVFGEYDYNKRSSYYIIKNLINNECPRLSSSEMLYDWTYIDDAVKGLIYVEKSKYNYKDYYIGDLKARKFSEIINDVKSVLAPDLKLKYGEYKEDSYIDYNMIDMIALNKDTNFEIKDNFKDNIIKTAMWIKNNNI